MNSRVAVGMLTSLGYTAVVATNGEEALSNLERSEYSAVLMDCSMPGMDGFTTTRHARAREGAERHTPIIAMTAHALRADRERCIAAGMDDYLAKPIRLATLSDALDRWTRLCLVHSDPPGSLVAALEPDALRDLRRAQPDADPHLVTDLVRIFIEEAPDRIQRMEVAIVAHDAESLTSTAHSLAGDSSLIGASEMERICRKLMCLGASDRTREAAGLLAELESAFDVARSNLEALDT